MKEKNNKLEEINKELERQVREHRRTLDALKESERRYKAVLETSPDPIVAYDMEGRVVLINPAFTHVFGWTLDELKGKKVDYVPQEEWDACMDLIEKVKRGESFSGVETRRFTKDGKILDISMSVANWRNAEGKPVGSVVTLQDITERKRLESQLIQAHKMESIGILAGGVAHDFNNLLTAIQGNTEIGMMRIDKDHPVMECMKRIRMTAQRAAELTRQLLIFSRKQPMEFDTVNINKIVENLLKMLRRLIGEDITVESELESDPWYIWADALNVEQVIMNMAVNARDAMPDGGTLTIRTANCIVDEHYQAMVNEKQTGYFLRLTISDTGHGIGKDILDHIFDPFFTTKEVGKGTGLGLSVVHGIVKQHGGWINVYSEPGQGSLFNVYFPAWFGDKSDKNKQDVEWSELFGEGETVLLVEDDDRVREMTAQALSENNYRVLTASTVKEAMEILEAQGSEIQVLFSDVVLPDENGVLLADHTEKFHPHILVLLCSGYPDQKAQWDKIRKRGFPFLQKPYALSDLFEAFKKILKKKRINR